MKVYVVSHGYIYEDPIAVAVYAEEEKAIDYVLSQPPEIEKDEERIITEHKMQEIPRSVPNTGRYFSNDWGEYYTIVEYDVI